MRVIQLLIIFLLLVCRSVFAADDLVFHCKRVERDFVEEYEMRLVPSTKTSKAKIYLDGRDLDQVDENGAQIVKSIVISAPDILMVIDARFEPETIGGVNYSAGTVFTQASLNQSTGKMRKVETIQGGILGVNLGNGTKTSEEECYPLKVSPAR